MRSRIPWSKFRSSRAGLSYLEVAIVLAILAALVVALFQFVFVTNRTYDQELYRRHMQFELQKAVDQVWFDLKESNVQLTRMALFTDPNFPAIPNCPTASHPAGLDPSIVLLVSNRQTLTSGPVPLDYTKVDSFSGLPSRDAMPQWSKLIIYAPFFNVQTREGTLMRYEVDRDAANAQLEKYFTNQTPQWPPAISPTTISLAGNTIVIPRATVGGTFRGQRVVAENLIQFNLLAQTNPVYWQVNIEAHRYGVRQEDAAQMAAYRAEGAPGRVGIFTAGRPRHSN